MKKLFSTLGMMAMISLCLFTSCKDEDVTAGPVNVQATINKAQVQQAQAQATAQANTEAIADAQAANPGATVTQATDGTIITSNPDGSKVETVVTTSYTYEVDGVAYNTIEEVQAALSKKRPGETAKVVAILHTTTTSTPVAADGTKGTPKVNKEDKSSTTNITIPEAGEKSEQAIKVPVSTKTEQTADINVSLATTTEGQHSGGQIR